MRALVPPMSPVKKVAEAEAAEADFAAWALVVVVRAEGTPLLLDDLGALATTALLIMNAPPMTATDFAVVLDVENPITEEDALRVCVCVCVCWNN